MGPGLESSRPLSELRRSDRAQTIQTIFVAMSKPHRQPSGQDFNHRNHPGGPSFPHFWIFSSRVPFKRSPFERHIFHLIILGTDIPSRLRRPRPPCQRSPSLRPHLPFLPLLPPQPFGLSPRPLPRSCRHRCQRARHGLPLPDLAPLERVPRRRILVS